MPVSGRSPGEGKGSPLQYSWASLVAQLVKNLPTMWETWVRSLGWKDPLEKGKAPHSSILAWREKGIRNSVCLCVCVCVPSQPGSSDRTDLGGLLPDNSLCVASRKGPCESAEQLGPPTVRLGALPFSEWGFLPLK